MTSRLTIVAVCFLGLACDTNQPVSDQSYFLRGQVIDSASAAPVAAAFVAYRNPTVPDSLIFVGDSLDMSNANSLLVSQTTDGQGAFEFIFFLGARDTSVYKLLVAYKSGFKVWRYDRSPVPITPGAEYIDHIVIPLAAH